MSPDGEPNIAPAKLAALENYVTELWPELTRHACDALSSLHDEKLDNAKDQHWPLYISASESVENVREQLRNSCHPEAADRIDIRILTGAPEQITEHGLVYLPGRYVVPGGRFNEMYGWDSYFIARGLLAEGQMALAQSMADQHLYQVKYYGTVLNCNRTYCLTRSQPPFLSRLVLEIHAATGDDEWLQSALPQVERFHAYWTSMPQFLPGVGLSRYYALGEGPAPEAVHGEVDAQGRNHYERLKELLRTHKNDPPPAQPCYDPATDSLTMAAYKDDRTVRESGFDLTGRFGPCGMGIRDHAPVCLNTLVWRMEKDIAEIHRRLGAPGRAIAHWEGNAEALGAAMQDHLWDEDAGQFFDWQLSKRKRSAYPFATTFWPLWAGWATAEQAEQVAENLSQFETPHGIMTSTSTTGCQWDAPYMWAPLVLMAVEGLARYGFQADAARIAGKFLRTLSTDFERTGKLFEKYHGLTGSSDVGEDIVFGYSTNEPGFGWTNASVRLLAKFCQSGGA